MFDIETYLLNFVELVANYQENPVRANWIDVRDQMVVHTRGVYPMKLIDQTRPSEPQEIKDYRKTNYEPITLDTMRRGINSLVRTMIHSNYNIEYSDNIKDYIKEHKFRTVDVLGVTEPHFFEEYMMKEVLALGIDDPNGLLVWLPENPDNPNLPPNKTDPTETIGVAPTYVSSDRIVDYTSEVVAFEALNQITVQDKENVKIAPQYFILTKSEIKRFYPYKFDGDGNVVYTDEIYYTLAKTPEDKFKEIPSMILGGDRVINEEDWAYYISFLYGFVPPGNEAIRGFTDDQGVRVRNNFPVIEEKGQICVVCKGAKRIPTEGGGSDFCDSCEGTGYTQISKSPYSTRLAKPPSPTENPEWTKRDAIKYYHPDVSIVERSNKTWREFLEDAKDAINLSFIKEAQSGVAKEIDREFRIDMLYKIMTNIFSLIGKSLGAIESYRITDAANRDVSVVTNPTSFKILTVNTILDELSNMIKNGIPSVFIIQAGLSLSEKLYNNDPVGSKIVNSIIQYDSLFPFSTTQINQLKAVNPFAITPEMLAIHLHAPQILMGIAQTNPNFVNMDFEDIKTAADDLIVDLIPEQQNSIVGDIENAFLD